MYMQRWLVAGVLRAGSVHLKPSVDAALVVDAETWEPGDGVPLRQFFQADHTLPLVIT